MSAIGAMFAPDQQATAEELVRVCRHGGTIAMANSTPDGGAGRFRRGGPDVPPPPPGPGPTAWSDPEHVAALFGPRVTDLVTEAGVVEVDFAGTAEELAALYLSSFPPVDATLADLAETPEREAAFSTTSLSSSATSTPPAGSATSTCSRRDRRVTQARNQSSSRQCGPTRPG